MASGFFGSGGGTVVEMREMGRGWDFVPPLPVFSLINLRLHGRFCVYIYIYTYKVLLLKLSLKTTPLNNEMSSKKNVNTITVWILARSSL